MYAWGWNKYGQLGLGHTLSVVPTPSLATIEPLTKGTATKVRGAQRVIAVRCGWKHSLCLTRDECEKSHVYTWGDNSFGQLGIAIPSYGNSGRGSSTSVAQRERHDATTMAPTSSNIATPPTLPTQSGEGVERSRATTPQERGRKRRIVPKRRTGGDGSCTTTKSPATVHPLPQLVEDLEDKSIDQIFCGWSFNLALSGAVICISAFFSSYLLYL